MSKNFVQPGNTVTVVCPAGGVSSGDLVVIGNLIGVAEHDAAAAAALEIATEGVFDLVKEAPLVIDEGDLVYWDSTPGNVNKTITAQPLVGVCVLDAASAAVVCRVKLLAGPATGN